MKNILIYIIAIAGFISCKPKIDTVTFSPGSANFSTYVAVGNSLTAGYADGALYTEGQINSYPNILAGQFRMVGGGDFKQPLINDENGIGLGDNINPLVTKRVLKLVNGCDGISSLAPVFAKASPNLLNFLTPIGSQAPFNNLGVPGAKSFQLLTPLLGKPYPQGNPFYGRFASNPGTSTVITDALSINPTFFTLWIGSNDVLLYAISGGDNGGDSITNSALFQVAMEANVNSLISKGAKGAIANVPDISGIPFFTTIPYNGLVLTSTAQVNALNSGYSSFGISFQLGQNPFIIQDASSTFGFRQIKSNELVLLTVPQDSIKCKGWGSLNPIPASYVLTTDEIGKIENAVISYNHIISSLAQEKGLALVDMNQRLKQIESGIAYSGITLNAEFVSGGAFSLDGIHLTPRGYAIVANYYIEAINGKFGASIPMVDITKYQGNQFP